MSRRTPARYSGERRCHAHERAFTGNGYIQNIINGEVNSFVARYRDNSEPLVSLETRMRFNPNLDPAWFGGVMAIINNITMLAIVLTGSALIREREHGTVEHLLVMPITPFEIMMAKIWSMGLVVLVVSGLSLVLMVKACWAYRLKARSAVYAGRGA